MATVTSRRFPPPWSIAQTAKLPAVKPAAFLLALEMDIPRVTNWLWLFGFQKPENTDNDPLGQLYSSGRFRLACEYLHCASADNVQLCINQFAHALACNLSAKRFAGREARFA
jgi:hypothetical protein